MYCVNCGAMLSDGSKFCSACGQATGANHQQRFYRDERLQMRSAEIAELDRLIAYFSQKQELFDEYDRVNRQVDYYNRARTHGLLVFGIILTVVSALLSGLGLSCTCSHLTQGNSSGPEALLYIIFVPLLLAGIIMIVLGIVFKKSFDSSAAKTRARFEELTNELYAFYLACPDCTVGCEYVNPSNLAAIRATLQSGRANTIEDAINLLLEDAHREEMQAAVNRAAQYAGNAAVFAAANFLINR